MKKIRQLAQRKATILFLLIIFGISNANNFNYSKINSYKSSTTVLASEIVFRELFFCDKSLSQKNIFEGLPFYEEYEGQLNNQSIEKQNERKQFVNTIIETIKTQNKDYFKNFDKIIASKNPYLIKKELASSYRVISNAILETSYKNVYEDAKNIYQKKYSKIPVKNSEDLRKITENLAKDLSSKKSYETGTCVAATVAVAVAAVALESLAVANMAVYASVFLWTKGKVFKEALELAYSDSSLLSDEIVARIIEYES